MSSRKARIAVSKDANLGAGFLFLKDDDMDTLYVANHRGKNPQVNAIHVPIDALQIEVVVYVKVMGQSSEYRMGDKREVGRGYVLPYDKGIRIRAPEDPQKSKLNIGVIRDFMDEEVWVNLRLEPC